jgi:outer membrane protein assembly factor BamB
MDPLVEPPAIHLAWTETLYELEELSYRPIEAASGCLLPGRAPSGADLLVLPGRDRHIRAIDTHTRELVWDVETLGANIAAPVPIGDDLLVASLDGRVRRIQIRNGRTVWETEPVGSGGVLEAPVVSEGRAFVTTTDNRLAVISVETGARVWDRRRPHRSELTISGQAGALVVGDRVITGTSDGLVVAYAVSDGATDWSTNLAGDAVEFMDVDVTPILAGGVIVTAGYATGLVGLSPSDGAVRWTLPGEGFTAAVAQDGIVYAPQANGMVTALEAQTGRVLWSSRIRRGSPRRPAVMGGDLLVPTERSLVVLDRATGRARVTYDDGFGFSATPVVSGRRAYAPANSGRLYALGLSTR